MKVHIHKCINIFIFTWKQQERENQYSQIYLSLGPFCCQIFYLSQLSVCQYCSSPNLSSDKDFKTLIDKTQTIMAWVINQLHVHLVYFGHHDIHFLK